MYRRLTRGIVLLAAIPVAGSLLISGCGSSEEADVTGLPDDATVVYAFGDSSVPPQYHRSVTLTVTADESRIVVDSYGDVLADESAPTPPQVWQQLGDTLPALEALEVDESQEGCVGGTTLQVMVSTPDAELLRLDPEFCGGSNEGIEAAIDAWIAPARDLFPPTDVLAPEGE